MFKYLCLNCSEKFDEPEWGRTWGYVTCPSCRYDDILRLTPPDNIKKLQDRILALKALWNLERAVL